MWSDDWIELRRQLRILVDGHPVTILIRRLVGWITTPKGGRSDHAERTAHPGC